MGVSDDSFEWNTGPMVATADDLGLRAVRIALNWTPGQRALSSADRTELARVVADAGGLRIVLAVFNQGYPPLDDTSRDTYCSFVGDAITRFPAINDVVIWNEPNLSGFWRPQFGPSGQSAPEQYEALLAHCYDTLHALRPSINVIAPATSLWGNDNPNAFSNISHSPTTFIQDLGAAYRASGRTTPIFDTVGHHPYPASSNERPWVLHADPAVISLGDLGRLLSVLQQAFGGTGQPVPQDGVPIWYLETGYQTTIPASKSAYYYGTEDWPGAVPDIVSPEPQDPGPPDTSLAPDQATQLADELRMTYCQPYVAAVFNFMLQDEVSLGGWQSGLLWSDGTRKGSYDAFKSVVAEVNSGTVNCSLVSGAPLVTAPPLKPVTTATATAARTATSPAKRGITKVTYIGARRGVYGFLRLRVRLTRGVVASKTVLKGRRIIFSVGKKTYDRYTNRAGVAQVAPTPPLPVGTHRVAIRYRGNAKDLGSGLHLGITAVNSPGAVRSQGVLHLPGGKTLRISARSNGHHARGALVVGKRSATVAALGVRTDGSTAWLRAADARGGRYLVHLERMSGGRVHVEVAGAATLRATVPSSRLTFSRGH
ncbi:MAG TPA: hypothetical protein VH538_13170 [Gaiellaceae bacterium]